MNHESFVLLSQWMVFSRFNLLLRNRQNILFSDMSSICYTLFIQISNALLQVIAGVLNLQCSSEFSKDLVKKENSQNSPRDSNLVGFHYKEIEFQQTTQVILMQDVFRNYLDKNELYHFSHMNIDHTYTFASLVQQTPQF